MTQATQMMLFLALLSHSSSAQNIVGTWQGVVHSEDRDVRTGIKVSSDGPDHLASVAYDLDKSIEILNGLMTVNGTAVKMTTSDTAIIFAGKESSDNDNITGTWSPYPLAPLPLALLRANNDPAWLTQDSTPRPPEQGNGGDSFEVATIKPSYEGETLSIRVQGHRFLTTSTSVSDLVAYAYGVHARQIDGGPAWLGTAKYDVLAQSAGDAPLGGNQLRAMVQALLTERFKLTFHHEKKVLSVYTIIVGKKGLRLKESADDPNRSPGVGFKATGEITVRNGTIGDFAGWMQRYVMDRPVLDITGLSGRYDFSVRWTPDSSQFGGGSAPTASPSNDANAPPDLYTALEEQTGLALRSTKEPVDTLVIDHVDPPTVN